MKMFLAAATISIAVVAPLLETSASLPLRCAGFLSGLYYCYLDRRKIRSPLSRIRQIKAKAWQQKRSLLLEINSLELQRDKKLTELEEQLAEVVRAEGESKKRAEEFFLEKKKELQAIARADEQAVNIQAQELSQNLEADKQNFLAEFIEKEQRLLGKIEALQQELASALWHLDKHEKPQMPEGVEPDKVAARKVIEILYSFQVVCDYCGSWLQYSYLYVRIRPRDCGIETVGKKKHLERIRLELALIEEPEIGPVPGAIELCLKPKYLAPLPIDDEHPTSTYKPPHPEVNDPQWVATLNRAYFRDFVEPETSINPYGDITQIEIDWVNWLWNYCQPPIRNQKTVIYRIWRAKSGDGKRFIRSRGRLRAIARQLGIKLRGNHD